jgi:hypothetical protein
LNPIHVTEVPENVNVALAPFSIDRAAVFPRCRELLLVYQAPVYFTAELFCATLTV